MRTYDAKSLALAEAFLEDYEVREGHRRDMVTDALAIDIQQAIENFLEELIETGALRERTS